MLSIRDTVPSGRMTWREASAGPYRFKKSRYGSAMVAALGLQLDGGDGRWGWTGTESPVRRAAGRKVRQRSKKIYHCREARTAVCDLERPKLD
jgi:hypothetical protein